METQKTVFQRVFKFEGIATLVGLIADIFTIGSILFALRLPEVTGKPLPFFITPALALAIWVIGIYVYFSLLHSFWEKNLEKNEYQKEFPVFLMYDLIIKFRSPFVLLPLIILIILYIFIVSDKFFGDTSPFCIIGLLIVGGICLGICLTNKDDWKENQEKVEVELKINNNWLAFEKRIKLELKRNYWLSYYELSDFASTWKIPSIYLGYVLRKYANEHPIETAYAFVYRTEDNKLITSNKVLIDLKSFPKDNYFYDSSLL